jgi:hypothetical protein
MFVGLLGEYGKILFAFSPYALSPNTTKSFPCILHKRLNTFRILRIRKKKENKRKEILTFNNA